MRLSVPNEVHTNSYTGCRLVIEPAIVNQNIVENHFNQLRGTNSQKDNPTYQTIQGTQNPVILERKLENSHQYSALFVHRLCRFPHKSHHGQLY